MKVLVHWEDLGAVEFDREFDRLRRAVDGEGSEHGVPIVAVLDDRGARERHLGVGFGVEEIGALEVAVAVGVVGIDRGQVDGCAEARRFETVADDQRCVERVELSTDFADAEMADGERDDAVIGVDLPGTGDEGEGRCCSCHDDLPWTLFLRCRSKLGEMNTVDLLKNHRSIRKFTDEPVTDGMVE